eukprot:gene19846-23737_t
MAVVGVRCMLSFLNDTHGWIVGMYGGIVYTQDGGSLWELQDPRTDQKTFPSESTALKGIEAIRQDSASEVNDNGVVVDDRLTLFTVGTEGTILRYGDASKSWEFQSAPVLVNGKAADLNAVDCCNQTHCFVVGAGGLVLYTDDSGDRWQRMDLSVTMELRHVVYLSDERAWIVGGALDPPDALIMYTSDSGATWQHIDSCSKTMIHQMSINQQTSMAWVVTEDGTICSSVDDGVTFQQQLKSLGTVLTSITSQDLTHPLSFGYLEQPGSANNYDQFLIDARHGISEGFISSSAIGRMWEEFYVDGVLMPLTWENIPESSWGHVHLRALLPFMDDINLFSHSTSGDALYSHGNLKGSLASVYLWRVALTQEEIDIIVQGYNLQYPTGYLAALFLL